MFQWTSGLLVCSTKWYDKLNFICLSALANFPFVFFSLYSFVPPVKISSVQRTVKSKYRSLMDGHYFFLRGIEEFLISNF